METVVLGITVWKIAYWILGIILAGAVINGAFAFAARSGRGGVHKTWVNLVGVGLPFIAFALALIAFFLSKNVDGAIRASPLFTWISIGDFTTQFALRLDHLSLTMLLIVTGVGAFIHLYSIGYMADDAGYARYFSHLNLFLFAMLVLILADNLTLMFVGWEGVGLCSYLLIGFWFTDADKAYAGKKAFIVNRIGDFGFILGMFLIYTTLSAQGLQIENGILDFGFLKANAGLLAPIATTAALLLFVGACGKSAQIPLYVWLPDAMAGPTPVSALIHAATMVTAGVYMICRLDFLYLLSPSAMEVVATVGATTAFFAATIGIAQNDIKKVLAYSTVSQLGYMFMAVGVGAFSSGIFHLMTHAFFKGCLFLCAGSVIHALHGEQDMWKMGGLKQKMPVTFITFAAATAAIVGIFPFAGFFSKDEILYKTFSRGFQHLWLIGFIASGITAFYMCRALALTFFGNMRTEKAKHAHESPPVMLIPLVVLALLSLVGGWVGIPESLRGGNHFHHWLQSALTPQVEIAMHEGHGLELALTLITFLWVFHLGLIALIVYTQKLAIPKKWSKKLGWFYKLVYNKYYIDEVYNFLIVRPIHFISDKILWKFSDTVIIDGLAVNGSAGSVGLFGRVLSLMQTGFVQNYALFITIGVIVLIACIAM